MLEVELSTTVNRCLWRLGHVLALNLNGSQEQLFKSLFRSAAVSEQMGSRGTQGRGGEVGVRFLSHYREVYDLEGQNE